MTNSPETILYQKAALIFEELCFLMPSPDNRKEHNDERTAAVVSFHGPFSGCLLVSLDSALLGQLSINMLGDENITESHYGQDSLCEIANVICGNTLPAVFGSRLVFHLDAPRLLTDSASLQPDGSFTRVAQTIVSFDGGQAEIALYADTASATNIN